MIYDLRSQAVVRVALKIFTNSNCMSYAERFRITMKSQITNRKS